MPASPRLLSRRVFLHTLALGLAASVVARPWRARAQEIPWTAIGFSQGGLPLVIHHLGDGPRRVLLLGGQHGAPEANTIQLVQSLMDHFAAHPEELPAGVGLDCLPIGNPDGAATGTRQYLDGVDPNRNWGGSDWQADAYDSDGHFRRGLGGPEPFSEQETRALRDWLLQNRPALVVNYHSAGGFLFGARQGLTGVIAQTYADASGYFRPRPGGPSPLPYRATGSLNVWLSEQGIPGLLVELDSTTDPEVERNLAALRAVLPLLAAPAG